MPSQRWFERENPRCYYLAGCGTETESLNCDSSLQATHTPNRRGQKSNWLRRLKHNVWPVTGHADPGVTPAWPGKRERPRRNLFALQRAASDIPAQISSAKSLNNQANNNINHSGRWEQYPELLFCVIENIQLSGHLAGSVCGACDSCSCHCQFEPSVGYREYFKI